MEVHMLKLFFILLAVGQLSAASWSPPTTLSKQVQSYESLAAVDFQGNAVSVFTHFEGDGRSTWIAASTKPLGGNWSTPVQLSQAVVADFPLPFDPRISIDKDGNAVVVWSYWDGDKTWIHAAILPVGSNEWIPAVKPLASTKTSIGNLNLVHDGEGNAVVSWKTTRNGQCIIESTKLKNGHTKWTPITPLKMPYPVCFVNLGANQKGKVWIMWMKQEEIHGVNVAVASLESDSSLWSDPEILAENGVFSEGRIEVDPNGNVFASWQTDLPEGLLFDVYNYSSKDKKWTETFFPQIFNHIYTKGKITFDAEGNALFVWMPDEHLLFSSKLPFGSLNWSEPTLINTECIWNYFSRTDRAGNSLLTWINGDDKVLKFSTMSADSNVWTDSAAIRPLDGSAVLESTLLNNNGSAIMLYYDYTTGDLKSIDGINLFP
jgi:hypothetical protein